MNHSSCRQEFFLDIPHDIISQFRFSAFLIPDYLWPVQIIVGNLHFLSIEIHYLNNFTAFIVIISPAVSLCVSYFCDMILLIILIKHPVSISVRSTDYTIQSIIFIIIFCSIRIPNTNQVSLFIIAECIAASIRSFHLLSQTGFSIGNFLFSSHGIFCLHMSAIFIIPVCHKPFPICLYPEKPSLLITGKAPLSSQCICNTGKVPLVIIRINCCIPIPVRIACLQITIIITAFLLAVMINRADITQFFILLINNPASIPFGKYRFSSPVFIMHLTFVRKSLM